MSLKARRLDEATELARNAFDVSASGRALVDKKSQISIGMLREERAWQATFKWVPSGSGSGGCTRDLLDAPLRIIATIVVHDQRDECDVTDHLAGQVGLLNGEK